MMRRLLILVAFVVSVLMVTRPALAATMAERLSGYILLQVEKNGEAWYVYPKTLTRFYLGRPSEAFGIMRDLGLGISNANLAKIPRAGTNDVGDANLQKQLSGYILLQVEKNGEAWYVYPKDLHRYYLGRPTEAFTIMRNLGLGISNTDLAQIPIDGGVGVATKNVTTSRGTFAVNYLTFDRKNPDLRIMTDTGNNGDCTSNCTTLSLGSYVSRRNGLAGIHGTYFCPADYASCAGQTNSYLYPVYNSFTGTMVNNGRIKYTTQPLIAFDTSNKPYYFHQAIDFVNKGTFQSTYGVTLRAAISNGPAMIENGANVLDTGILDSKQATVKSYRGALGWKGDTVYLIVVSSATVTDSAAVLKAMGLDYAINLDGGGSTALYNAGRYILGPGRSLPNAVLITQ